VKGGEAELRKEQNKDLTSKRAPIDLTPLPKTQKLAIDLRSPITANLSPNPASHLQTSTNSTKMSTEQSQSTSAAGSPGHIASSTTGPACHAGAFCNDWYNHPHNQRQCIEFLAVPSSKGKKQIPLVGTMGTPVFGGADQIKFIEGIKCVTPFRKTNTAAADDIGSFPYYCSETI
jgi:hypothetical protein